MQISVRTPQDLTVLVLEKCALLNVDHPSSFACECVMQSTRLMNRPHSRFVPLDIVAKYYYSVGREGDLFPDFKNRQLESGSKRLEEKFKGGRVNGARDRLETLRKQWKDKSPPKHLSLKISAFMTDLPKVVKAKAQWLKMKPNAFVVACLRDCIAAMDDPKKALMPPPIVTEYWNVSKAHLQPKSNRGRIKLLRVWREKAMRERGEPILDVVVRCALNQEWDTTLKQILEDAGFLLLDDENGKHVSINEDMDEEKQP